MTCGYNRKTGLVSTLVGARLSIEFKNIQKEIRYWNVLTLKSYHMKWKDGVVRFHLLVNPNLVGVSARKSTFEISGWWNVGHNDVDSTYHFEVDLGEEHKAPVGSDVMVQMELVSGEGFKILGMMLCS
uniref:Uncharacterized protein n=1 Tax=Ditylum brightwellii TaxID=49249 RepID=A0A6U3RXV0_9STRA